MWELESVWLLASSSASRKPKKKDEERKKTKKKVYIGSFFSGELNIDCAVLVFGCSTIFPLHHRLRQLKVWLIEDEKRKHQIQFHKLTNGIFFNCVINNFSDYILFNCKTYCVFLNVMD